MVYWNATAAETGGYNVSEMSYGVYLYENTAIRKFVAFKFANATAQCLFTNIPENKDLIVSLEARNPMGVYYLDYAFETVRTCKHSGVTDLFSH